MGRGKWNRKARVRQRRAMRLSWIQRYEDRGQHDKAEALRKILTREDVSEVMNENGKVELQDKCAYNFCPNCGLKLN